MTIIRHDTPMVYISGPMTGLPDLNYPAFFEAAKQVEAKGWVAVNPAGNGLPAGLAWVSYMREDIAMLMKCTAILLLPGWEKSKGARLEHHIASQLGMDVYLLRKDAASCAIMKGGAA
jgi:hypothetical protein